uniref:(northern house mosquito) hypothetical protein n=1 Tax=Culex pipiens TaxID=7175 RepID=A0A8D8IHE6_CULPI
MSFFHAPHILGLSRYIRATHLLLAWVRGSWTANADVCFGPADKSVLLRNHETIWRNADSWYKFTAMHRGLMVCANCPHHSETPKKAGRVRSPLSGPSLAISPSNRCIPYKNGPYRVHRCTKMT